MNWGIALARAYHFRRGECRVRRRAEADGAHEDVELEGAVKLIIEDPAVGLARTVEAVDG